MTTQKPKGLRAEVGYTKLYVPHLDGELTFAHPYKGPARYAELADELDKARLGRPTFSQNSSLIYSAWETQKEDPKERFLIDLLYQKENAEERLSKEIINSLRKNWLACFTGIHYIPNEGAYIQDLPEIKDGRVFMEKSVLVKKLEENDPSVRFVSFGYQIGEHSASKLEINPFIKGLAGEEGAQKIAEVSRNYKHKTCVSSFKNVDEPTTKLSALSTDRDLVCYLLSVYGDIHYDVVDGCVLGVFPKTREGGSQNFSEEKDEQYNPDKLANLNKY